MSSLYKRIQSNSIRLGDSFVFEDEKKEEENKIPSLLEQKLQLQSEIREAQEELELLRKALKDLFTQKATIIESAKKEGEDFKAKAILKAEEILAEANAQKKAILDESKELGTKQGFEAGYNAGQEQFIVEYKKQIDALNVLTNAAFEVKKEIVFSAETDILELALLIAQKVVQTEFDNNKNCFKNMTQTALSLLKENENVRIVVNPKLLEYANEIAPELSSKIDGIEKIKIVQDKSVSSDGVVVESVESRIDARISTQLETLARTLLIDKRIQEVLSEEIEEKIAQKIKNKDVDE